MHIVVTNDDGFESANLQALFAALKAAGHEVIMCAPYADQSGMSARLRPLSEVRATIAASPGRTLPAGSPPFGPTGIAPNQYYVNDAPATALVYALETLAPAKWGGPPDLVIAGPNTGNNLGTVTPHSGTVGAAVTALNRGVPALAVSGASGDPATAPLLAEIALRVVNAFMAPGKATLTKSLGLNVNVPALDVHRTAASYRCVLTQVSTDGASTVALGGGERVMQEDQAFGDGNTVTVSPLEGTYQASPDRAALVLSHMRSFFASTPAIANPKFTNISVRGFVGTGDAAQIVGFVVSGDLPKTVLVRAAGPALASFNVAGPLADPLLAIYDADGKLVATSDNWCEDAGQAASIAAIASRVGAYPWPAGSKDAAVVVTLAPGRYTAMVKGVNNVTGVALAEVYDARVD